MNKFFELAAKNFDAMVETQSKINQSFFQITKLMQEKMLKGELEANEWQNAFENISKKQSEIFDLLQTTQERIVKENNGELEKEIQEFSENQKKIFENATNSLTKAQEEWLKNFQELFKSPSSK